MRVIVFMVVINVSRMGVAQLTADFGTINQQDVCVKQ